MELISVVVITYNAEQTIENTLDSVASQTYQRLELIVSDDCSTDSTLDVVSKWMSRHAQRFERAMLVKAPYNTGVAANANRGIKKTIGKYFTTLAGDDEWYPQKIEREFAFLKANGYEMVFSKIDISGTNIEAVQNLNNYCEEGYRSIEKGYEQQKELILQRNIVAGPSWGVRTKASYEQMGGFNEDYPFLDDFPYLYRYIMQGKSIHLLGEVLAKYKLRDRNLSVSNNVKFKESNEKFFWQEWIYDLLKYERYDLLERLIPWNKSMLNDVREQMLFSAWIYLKRYAFSLDDYFKARNIARVMLIGNEEIQESVINDFCKAKGIKTNCSIFEFIQGEVNTITEIDAFLICDVFSDEHSRLMCYQMKPVYYLQDILKRESKSKKKSQL